MSYDEFSMLVDNASEAGLPWGEPPTVERVEVGGVSALRWGDPDDAPELVLIHGTAQNAHTWDTVALALGRPLLAVDLPGHGRSAWKDDFAYDPWSLAADLVPVVEQLAPEARAVVGMSLGGMTSLCLQHAHPLLVRRLCMIDITPGVNRDKSKEIFDFISGPETFATFDEILARTIQFNPSRSESSLRRGVLHNAHELPDGTWTWNYDRRHRPPTPDGEAPKVDRGYQLDQLWDYIAAVDVPFLFVRGGASPVVDDADEAELRKRNPEARVETVDGAGHSVQGDRPLELAALLEQWLSGSS